MSTRGEMIIRKDSKEKRMYIGSDAYPSCAGDRVCCLVQELNDAQLERLFQLMEPVRDETGSDFSRSVCKRAVHEDKPLLCYVSNLEKPFILDSLFCEYAYVINLDEKVVEYYEGFQKVPQEGNRYGEEPSHESPDNSTKYYPCRLCLVITFDYIRTHTSNHIVEQMVDCGSDGITYIGFDEEVFADEDNELLKSRRMHAAVMEEKILEILMDLDAIKNSMRDLQSEFSKAKETGVYVDASISAKTAYRKALTMASKIDRIW